MVAIAPRRHTACGVLLLLFSVAVAEEATSPVAAVAQLLSASIGESPAPLVLSDDDAGGDKDKDAHNGADTTTPPADDSPDTTTTPPTDESARSILLDITKVASGYAHQGEHQWVVAVVAFLVGCVMIGNSDQSFKMILIGVVFLTADVLAMSEASTVPIFGGKQTFRVMVGLEVGLVAAWGAWLGMDGVVAVAAAMLGGLVAFGVQAKLASLGATVLMTETVLVICFYTFFVGLAMYLVYKKKHQRGLSLILTVVGSSFVVATLAWGITSAVTSGHLQFLFKLFPSSSPQEGKWVDFLCLLWSPSSSDVGLFAGSKLHLGQWSPRTDRTIGLGCWMVLVVAAVLTRRFVSSKTVVAGKSNAKSNLNVALLANKV